MRSVCDGGRRRQRCAFTCPTLKTFMWCEGPPVAANPSIELVLAGGRCIQQVATADQIATVSRLNPISASRLTADVCYENASDGVHGCRLRDAGVRRGKSLS